jgi:predicted metal-dependent enzyme (double-stranded beta helix superfamily)
MTTTQTVTGLDELISCLDAAVQRSTPEEITGCIKDTLERLSASGALELPAAFTEPRPDRYARRLLHKSAEHGYTAIVMTWGPGQGTPLHDHAGMWCVESVIEGQIEVTQYDLESQDGERYRFRREGTITAGPGEAGALIPPFEYHTIANTAADRKAVTLHVYAGEMQTCTVFQPAADGAYERLERQLSYCE